MSKRNSIPANNCGNLQKGTTEGSFKSMLEEYDYSVLDKVDNVEFSNIVKETVARKIALELDLISNAELVPMVKKYGIYALKDEMDIIELRAKLAELNKDVQFYKLELKKLKDRYSDALPEEQEVIMEKMEFFENQISKYDNLHNKTRELMAKVRYQIQRRKQWQEEQKGKQKDDKIIDVSDFNFEDE